jgi:hypothetical protein
VLPDRLDCGNDAAMKLRNLGRLLALHGRRRLVKAWIVVEYSTVGHDQMHDNFVSRVLDQDSITAHFQSIVAPEITDLPHPSRLDQGTVNFSPIGQLKHRAPPVSLQTETFQLC